MVSSGSSAFEEFNVTGAIISIDRILTKQIETEFPLNIIH
jgi:hypothetical protein